MTDTQLSRLKWIPAMSITGHKTRAVFDRYNIVNEEDIRQGLERTFEHLSGRRVKPLFSGNIGHKADI